MSILTAPIKALYDISFYKQVIQSKLSKGFLYLLYLTLIVTVLAFFGLNAILMPRLEQGKVWLQENMPELVWTEQGMSMVGKDVYDIDYNGLKIIFDMTKQSATEAEIGDTLLFVTSQKMYLREAGGQQRIYDFQQIRQANNLPSEPIRIDAQTIDKVFQVAKPWVAVFGTVGVFFGVFFWKLFVALFYSLIGLIINNFRKEKLKYGQIFNVTFFAMTAVIWIQVLQSLIMPLGNLPFGFIGSLLVTGVYLFIGIKKTENSAEAA